MRINEYFTPVPIVHETVICNPPQKLFPQERDWTCAIACIRTILSGIEASQVSEEAFIQKYHLKPGPLFSKDIKALGILNDYDTVYGCDVMDVTFDQVLSYCESGYYVMIESMLNYSHWFVLLGYYPSNDLNQEASRVLVYDPYYNKPRLLIAAEFIDMWLDGNHHVNSVEKDFVAFKAKITGDSRERT